MFCKMTIDIVNKINDIWKMNIFFLFFFFERGTKDIITNFIAFLKIADILL